MPGVLEKAFQFVEEMFQIEDDVLVHFLNGKKWRNLNFNGKKVLPLFLFSGEFECSNPFGAAKGVHKITA